MINLFEGKYGIKNENGKLTAYRHGEEWDEKTTSLIGDKFTLALVSKIEELEEQIQIMKDVHTDRVTEIKENTAMVKSGMTLTVRRDLDSLHEVSPSGIVDEMLNFVGKKVTVDRVHEDNSFAIVEDEWRYSWDEIMFEEFR